MTTFEELEENWMNRPIGTGELRTIEACLQRTAGVSECQ